MTHVDLQQLGDSHRQLSVRASAHDDKFGLHLLSVTPTISSPTSVDAGDFGRDEKPNRGEDLSRTLIKEDRKRKIYGERE